MSTTAKGDLFELAVLERVKRAVANRSLGLVAENCRVFHQKGYYSPDRKGMIVSDVSVELYNTGADVPYLIWIWECKDYARPIPVDDVEEFHAKLQQIGADRTKGTLIVSGEFTRATIEFASVKGIGLARLLPRDRIHFVRFDNKPVPVSEADYARELKEERREVLAALTQREFHAHIDEPITFDYGLYAIRANGDVSRASGVTLYMLEQLRDWEILK